MNFKDGQKLIDKTEEAYQLLTRAGYQAQITFDANQKPVIVVQDPVHAQDPQRPGWCKVVSYNEAKIYGSVGETILSNAVRFIEQRE